MDSDLLMDSKHKTYFQKIGKILIVSYLMLGVLSLWHSLAELHSEFATKIPTKSLIVFTDELILITRCWGDEGLSTGFCKRLASCLFLKHVLKCFC